MARPRQTLSEEQRTQLHGMVQRGLRRIDMAAQLGMSKHILDRHMAYEGLRSTAIGAPSKAPPQAFPTRLPQGVKVTLPPLPSLADFNDKS